MLVMKDVKLTIETRKPKKKQVSKLVLPKATLDRIRKTKNKDAIRRIKALNKIAAQQTKAVLSSVHVPAVTEPDSPLKLN